MSYPSQVSVLTVFGIIVLGAVLAALFGAYKDAKQIPSIWRVMSQMEKFCLVYGFSLLLFVPLVTKSETVQGYIGSVAVALIAALSEGLFLVGVIAFVQHAHDRPRAGRSEQTVPTDRREDAAPAER